MFEIHLDEQTTSCTSELRLQQLQIIYTNEYIESISHEALVLLKLNMCVCIIVYYGVSVQRGH